MKRWLKKIAGLRGGYRRISLQGNGGMGSKQLEAGGMSPPKPMHSRGERLDCGETAGLDDVGSGSVVMSSRAHVGICLKGQEGVPRRSPGSRSVDHESGIVWYLLATKISVSEETPSWGSMSTRRWPVKAETPEGRTELTGTRNGVDDDKISCTPANSRWKVSVVGRLKLMKVEGPSVRGAERESSPKIGWEG